MVPAVLECSGAGQVYAVQEGVPFASEGSEAQASRVPQAESFGVSDLPGFPRVPRTPPDWSMRFSRVPRKF